MTFTFAVLALTILLLVSGRLRPDLVALMALLALFLGGIVDTQQALAGFADTTVILIAVLFVVGEGIYRSGFAAWLGRRMVQAAGSSPNRLLVLVMVATAALSAFISNIGTVAMMIPVVVAAAWGMNPGDYEMGDYARLGLPLVIAIFLVSLILVPLIWPL